MAMGMLNSLRTLVPEEYPPENVTFVEENGIQHFQIHISANKDPFVTIPPKDMAAALEILLDRRNHPLLIHCNKGKVSAPIGIRHSYLVTDFASAAPYWLCRRLLSQAPGLESCIYPRRVSPPCKSES